MMKRILPLLFVVVVLLALSGCEQMFSFNAFASFATPSFPATANDVNTIITENQDNPQGFIDTISAMTASDAFFRDLATNPDKASVVSAITTELTTISTAGSGATDEERLQAAVLAVNVYFGSSEATTVVESVSNSLLGVLDGTTTISSFSDALDTIFGAALQNVSDVPGALDALNGASNALNTVADLFPTVTVASVVRAQSTSGTTTGSTVDPGTALNWAVSIALSTFLDEYRSVMGLSSDWNDWSFALISEVVDNPDSNPDYDTVMSNTIADLENNNLFIEMMNICGLASQFNLPTTTA